MKEYKSYEDAVKRLEEVVSLMESGDLPLDESLKLFEEGTKLTSYCYETLKRAQQKIDVLTLPEEQNNEQ